jgi:sterol-4alpha-carboxylate 3-dehydrogenase (decarboxylating)
MDSKPLGSVLVIGGCGCLGYHIAQQLSLSGDASTITVFDISVQNNRLENVTYIQGDLSSAKDVLAALRKAKPLVVINTASPKLMGVNSRTLFAKVNITGTEVLLASLKELGVTKALIYTSSSSVIHDNTTDLTNATEDAPLCFEPAQKEYYTHTKAVAEEMVLKANNQNGMLTAVIRAALLFGEGDNTSTPQIVENARSGKGKFRVGNGKNLFDFTYVGNTAHAHILAAKALLRESGTKTPIPDNKRINGEAFVITNDEPWPFWDYTLAVGAKAGFPVDKKDIWVIPAWLYYVLAVVVEWVVWVRSFGTREPVINRRMVKYLTLNRTFNISKAKERLGYRPLVNMEEGIRRAVQSSLARSDVAQKTK